METKALTGIFENIKGFTGGKAIVRDKTLKGRSRIFFDLYVGVESIPQGKYPTLRHCIVYGDAADALKDINKGSYVEVTGFIQTVALRDKAGVFITENGAVKKEEHLISEKARHILREEYQQGRQLPLAEEALASVGQVS